MNNGHNWRYDFWPNDKKSMLTQFLHRNESHCALQQAIEKIFHIHICHVMRIRSKLAQTGSSFIGVRVYRRSKMKEKNFSFFDPIFFSM